MATPRPAGRSLTTLHAVRAEATDLFGVQELLYSAPVSISR